MSPSDVVHDMDPAVRAVAEVRAREAGVSLAEWLEALVYEQAAPAQVRRHVFFGGVPTTRSAMVSGSAAVSPPLLASAQSDVDTMAYVPMSPYPEIENVFLGRLSTHGNIAFQSSSPWENAIRKIKRCH